MEWEERKARIRRVLAAIEAIYPPDYTRNARELMAVNEWKIALEFLCDNLSEAPGALPREIFDELSRVADAMGVDRRYWESLEVQ